MGWIQNSGIFYQINNNTLIIELSNTNNYKSCFGHWNETIFGSKGYWRFIKSSWTNWRTERYNGKKHRIGNIERWTLRYIILSRYINFILHCIYFDFLELLVNKTDQLRSNAVSFRTTSRTLARTMFWRNVKMYFIVASIILLLVYIIVSISCGGLLWPSCVH